MYSFFSRRPFLHPLNPLYQNVPTSATILSFADYLTFKPPPIYPNPSLRAFSRSVISKVFGGNTQKMFSRPATNRVRSGNTINFCYLPDWNPWGPPFPGAAGVIFMDVIGSTLEEVTDPGPNGLTVSRPVQSPENWASVWSGLGRPYEKGSPMH